MAASSSKNEETREENTTEDSGVSMVDILNEEQQLEADANAVLGDSNHNQCTYLMGYAPRQALYACATCTTPDRAPAGICLACSYECHEGHKLHELYTKRGFRCDCGNSRFPELTCKFFEKKFPNNEENKYNQNFRGTYCTCGRPYPDPEDSIEDEMIQCVICEDWYHGRHLGTSVPDNEDYHEMICTGCMVKNEFLWAYTALGEEVKLQNAETTEIVDVETETTDVNSIEVNHDDSTKSQASPEKVVNNVKSDTVVSKENCEAKSESGHCKLKELQTREITQKRCATFWPDNWRSKLCHCGSCKAMYEKHAVSFLTDLEDTVQAYEERGKTDQDSHYEKGMQALSNMDRVQQVEVLHGFNDLKSELSDYLRKFAENGKVVREEDIREFFGQMEARKRQKTTSAIPHFCR